MFNKKFFISLLFSMILTLSCFTLTTFADEGAAGADSIKVLLDGKYMNLKEPPVEIAGRTLVPLRDIFESLGATLYWDENTSTVIGNKDSQNIVLQINNPTAYINGAPVSLSVPGTIVNEKTMVPARFIAESMNCVVSWDEDTKTVIILKNKEVDFGDKNIEDAVKSALKIDKDKIEVSDLVNIKKLTIKEKNISNLDGLEYFSNLETLELKNNDITDISKLSGLIKLKYLDLSFNKIINLEPLEGLKGLKELDLESNKIADIKPLSELTNLTVLNIPENKISNLEPLKNNTKLRFLNLYYTMVEDITPIAYLKELTSINLANTQITDISVLKNNSNLTALNIVGDAVLDISPIKSLKKLKTFYYQNAQNTELNNELFEKNEELKNRAKSIIDKIIKPGMSDLDKELAIHDYIILNTKYDSDGYINGTVSNNAHSPYGVLLDGVGVCDGYAYTMKSLLKMVNINSFVIHGKSFNLTSSPIGHAWNMVNIGGKYYYVDLTWDDTGSKDGINSLSHDYFNISAKQISVDHKFDRDFYPIADTDSVDFARFNDVYHLTAINDDYTYTCSNWYLYKIDNSTQIATKLSTDEISEIAYNDGWIYYINYSNDNKIYKMKTDGTENTLLSEDSAVHIYLKNNYIYYVDRITDVHRIHRMDLDGKNNNTINYDTLTTTLYFSHNKLFFKVYSIGNGSKFYSSSMDGNNKINIIDASLGGFKKSSSSIKYSYLPIELIKDSYIYYINADDGNTLYRIKETGTEKKQISKNSVGDESYNYHVIGDWIYYVNSSDKKFYKVKIDGSQESLAE